VVHGADSGSTKFIVALAVVICLLYSYQMHAKADDSDSTAASDLLFALAVLFAMAVAWTAVTKYRAIKRAAG